MTMKDIMEAMASEIVATDVFKTAIVNIMIDNIKLSVENVKANVITEVMEKVRIQTQAHVTMSEVEVLVDEKLDTKVVAIIDQKVGESTTVNNMVDDRLDNILQQKVEVAAERLNLMNKDEVQEEIETTMRNGSFEVESVDIRFRP